MNNSSLLLRGTDDGVDDADDDNDDEDGDLRKNEKSGIVNFDILQKVGEINLLLCIKSLFRSVLFKFVALTCALLFINYLFTT